MEERLAKGTIISILFDTIMQYHMPIICGPIVNFVLASKDVDRNNLKIPFYDEDNDSEYVFICINPKKLGIPIDHTGQHKLCMLERIILKFHIFFDVIINQSRIVYD
jgi:hypothetical protein